MWIITVQSWNFPESDPKTRIWVQIIDVGGRHHTWDRPGRKSIQGVLRSRSHAPWGLLGAYRGQATEMSQWRGEVVNLLVQLPLVNGWGLLLGVITSWHFWSDSTPKVEKAFRLKVPVVCSQEAVGSEDNELVVSAMGCGKGTDNMLPQLSPIRKMPLLRLKWKLETITEHPFCAKNFVWH